MAIPADTPSKIELADILLPGAALSPSPLELDEEGRKLLRKTQERQKKILRPRHGNAQRLRMVVKL
jgi:hypothetical protein